MTCTKLVKATTAAVIVRLNGEAPYDKLPMFDHGARSQH
jgi:hypothetical protein